MATMWGALGALVPLNHLGHYLQWGWIQISVSNLIVIVAMVAVFVGALFVRFPGKRSRREGKNS